MIQSKTPLFLAADRSAVPVPPLATVDSKVFKRSINRLHSMFSVYACTSPEPLPAPGLLVTPEIRGQCELYLPIAEIAYVFNRLYSAALTYPPILSSTPFHDSISWADCFGALPECFQLTPNPARLLEYLLADQLFLTSFLFASFLPKRFYGGIGRYPLQKRFLMEWFKGRRKRALRCLDAACGTGEDTYGLVTLLAERGYSPGEISVDGWTLEPLEVWVATHRSFPHDLIREAAMREATAPLFLDGYGQCVCFRSVDILRPFAAQATDRSLPISSCYDLIVCNGLLGGPLLHKKHELNSAIANMTGGLVPGGVLLAADNFHEGWKQKCPQAALRASFEACGLQVVEAGEGICGLKPY